MKKHKCEDCKMRKKYEKSPKSLIGRFWRWHIKFCPGWKAFVKSLDESQAKEIATKYKLSQS